MFTSLKFRMNAGFMSIIFVSVLLVGLAASMYSAKESLRNFESHARRQMGTLAAMTEFFYDEVRNDIDQLAGSPVVGGAERGIYELFEHYAMYHPGTLRVCMATEDAGYVQWPEADVAEDFDPRTQQWYAKGMHAAGRVVEMEPYLELSTGEIVVRLVRSFKNMDGASHGVVAIDISMRRLAILLSRKVIGESGRVMMIHTSGIALTDLAFPESDLKNASELGIEGFERMFGPNALFSATIDGETHILSSVRSDATGWIFAAVAREKDVMSATRAIQKMLLLISIGVGLVSVILIICLSSALNETVKTQEKKINESKKLIQTVIDNSTPLIYVKDLEGRYILGNAAWRRRSAKGIPEPIGLTDFDLFPEEVAASLRENDRLTLEIRRSQSWDETATDEAGKRVDYYSIKFPLLDSNGEPYAVCGMSTDITERRKTEEALREKEARLRVIFEKSPLGLSLHAGDGTILDCNEKSVELMGSSRERLIGFNPLASGSPVVKEIFSRALTGESGTFDAEYTSQTGSRTCFFRISFNPVEHDLASPRVIVSLEDITERKRAEDILRESEMRHRIIFENSPLGMIRFSDDGTILDCNDKFVELMGSAREKLIGFNTARRSSPEMREKIRIALEGKPSEYENEYTSVNGSKTLYLRVVFNPIEPGKNPTGVIATLEDITEAKKAEAALRESEMRHRIIFEKSPLGLALHAHDSTILDCNEKFVELMGSSRDKLIGFKSLSSGSPVVQETFERALKGESGSFEREFTSVTGGKTNFLRISFNPVEPGLPSTHVIVTLEDITDKKRAEEILQESEMRHRIIFEKSPLGLVRFDGKGVITDCNQRYLEIMGATREKLIGFDALHRSTPEMRERIGAALEGEPSVYEGEFTSVVGGRRFFMRIAFNPLDSGKRSSGVIATVEDITERKTIERQVRENLEELERFSRLVIGREERMIQLKQEVNEFLISQGLGPKYKIVE